MPFSHASFSIIWLWAAERLKLEFEHLLWNTGQTTLLGSLLRGWFPQIKWQGAKSEDGSGGIWWLGEWGLNTPSQQGWLESLRRAVIKNSLGIRSPKGNQSGIWIKSSSPKMYQTQHRWISCYGRECRWWYPEKELRSNFFSFSSFYHNGTNMMAETRALRDGFKLCSDKGIQVNDIESDSKVMVDSILGLISTPWHVLYLIRECISLLSSGMMVSHIYRQGNSIADRLASHPMDDPI